MCKLQVHLSTDLRTSIIYVRHVPRESYRLILRRRRHASTFGLNSVVRRSLADLVLPGSGFVVQGLGSRCKCSAKESDLPACAARCAISDHRARSYVDEKTQVSSINDVVAWALVCASTVG